MSKSSVRSKATRCSNKLNTNDCINRFNIIDNCIFNKKVNDEKFHENIDDVIRSLNNNIYNNERKRNDYGNQNNVKHMDNPLSDTIICDKSVEAYLMYLFNEAQTNIMMRRNGITFNAYIPFIDVVKHIRKYCLTDNPTASNESLTLLLNNREVIESITCKCTNNKHHAITLVKGSLTDVSTRNEIYKKFNDEWKYILYASLPPFIPYCIPIDVFYGILCQYEQYRIANIEIGSRRKDPVYNIKMLIEYGMMKTYHNLHNREPSTLFDLVRERPILSLLQLSHSREQSLFNIIDIFKFFDGMESYLTNISNIVITYQSMKSNKSFYEKGLKELIEMLQRYYIDMITFHDDYKHLRYSDEMYIVCKVIVEQIIVFDIINNDDIGLCQSVKNDKRIFNHFNMINTAISELYQKYNKNMFKKIVTESFDIYQMFRCYDFNKLKDERQYLAMCCLPISIPFDLLYKFYDREDDSPISVHDCHRYVKTLIDNMSEFEMVKFIHHHLFNIINRYILVISNNYINLSNEPTTYDRVTSECLNLIFGTYQNDYTPMIPTHSIAEECKRWRFNFIGWLIAYKIIDITQVTTILADVFDSYGAKKFDRDYINVCNMILYRIFNQLPKYKDCVNSSIMIDIIKKSYYHALDLDDCSKVSSTLQLHAELNLSSLLKYIKQELSIDDSNY